MLDLDLLLTYMRSAPSNPFLNCQPTYSITLNIGMCVPVLYLPSKMDTWDTNKKGSNQIKPFIY